jgi:uncharacterized FlaG/YvyC family protein
MSILNKVDVVGASAITQMIRPAKVDATAEMGRQAVADAGKLLPNGAQQAEQMSEAKRRELQSAVKNVSGYVQNIARELIFHVDEELGTTVVTVVDEQTGEVVRQLPSEELLELAKSLAELKEKTTKGLLFRGDA